MSTFTIHQAKFQDGRLNEVVILCRDEPEPPVFFYEETVMSVEQVIESLLHGDLIYAQWGENCFPLELLRLGNGDETIEVAQLGQPAEYRTLANLPCEAQAFG